MINGIINIYKEKGYTSHDVVAKLRGIVSQKKIGHTGTLDPDAVGVLPVCLGKGTKLCDMLTDKDKVYEAVLLLGITTDTEDTSGTILEQKPVTISEDQVREIVQGFVGEYDQIPPMYSALKVNGKKLYELARAGQVVERSPRKVLIHAIEIVKIELPRVTMRIHCSKGTYIRSLCRDIGQAAGCGGCMEELTRTRVGIFSIEDSYTLDQIIELRDTRQLSHAIHKIENMFLQYESVTVSHKFDKLIYNGNKFGINHTINAMIPADGQLVRVYDEDQNFIGIYEYCDGQKLYSPRKMFI